MWRERERQRQIPLKVATVARISNRLEKPLQGKTVIERKRHMLVKVAILASEQSVRIATGHREKRDICRLEQPLWRDKSHIPVNVAAVVKEPVTGCGSPRREKTGYLLRVATLETRWSSYLSLVSVLR